MKQPSKYFLFCCVFFIALFLCNSCKKEVSPFLRKNKKLLDSQTWQFRSFFVDGLDVTNEIINNDTLHIKSISFDPKNEWSYFYQNSIKRMPDTVVLITERRRHGYKWWRSDVVTIYANEQGIRNYMGFLPIQKYGILVLNITKLTKSEFCFFIKQDGVKYEYECASTR
jgi:hypothetical protein